MNFKAWLIGTALCMTLLPLSAVCAASAEASVKASNKAAFTDVVAAVQQEMKPGGRYEFVDDTERATINAKLGDMQSLFDKYSDVAQMNQDAKVQLLSDQETVNAILTHRDDRRLICKSERPIGSLLPKRTCRTYGETERNYRDTQQFMEQQARPGAISGGH